MTEERYAEIPVDEIVYREDLYPRFNPNAATIQQYSESIEVLPPIEVNQHNELIDGYHRWIAHRKENAETIKATVTETKSDIHFLKLAIIRNAKHGLQLSNEEKKHLVLKMYISGDAEEKAEFAKMMSVSERTIKNWTSRKDKDLKAKRNQDIFDLWLACYTEDEIAEKVGVDQKTVSNIISGKKENLQKFLIFANYQDPDWKPPLYNVWKLQNKTNKVSHFGNSEASLLDNLLYLYTDPFDIVVDPFAGGGSTIDVCKQRLRRYWASDRLPIIERTDIRQLDITDSDPPLHKRWNKVRLVFLDPPYWIQAKGEYSKDKEDLANMELSDFYQSLTKIITVMAKKMDFGHIALMIQPTQWKAENKQVVDHVVDLIKLVGEIDETLRLDMRISCPYESQQYNAQQVEWAKSHKKVLLLTREIIVWEKIDDKTS